jgi:hypothetical protein
LAVSGLLTVKCATNAKATYFEVTIHGHRVLNGKLQDNRGLQFIDVNLAMRSPVDIVGQGAKAWRASGK